MAFMKFKLRLAMSVLCTALAVSTPVLSQERTAATLMDEANALFLSTGGMEASAEDLLHIREILDKIVAEFPASDVAVRILLQDEIESISVAALDEKLSKLTLGAAPDEASASGIETAVAPKIVPEVTAISGEVETKENPTVASAGERDTPVDDSTPSSEPVASTDTSMANPQEQEAPKQAMALSTADDPFLAFKTAISMCFEGVPNLDGQSRAVASFHLDYSGRLEGIPEWAGETEASPSQRRIFLTALYALESCAPYSMNLKAGRYEAEFSPLAIENVVYTNDASVVKVPEPSRSVDSDIKIIHEWKVADEASEKTLALQKADIAEIQARLLAIGFDPNGIDGVLGGGTRTAISSWQGNNQIPQTGYLDAEQLAALRTESQSEFENWQMNQENQSTLAKASTQRQKKKVRVKVCSPVLGGTARWCRYEWRYR